MKRLLAIAGIIVGVLVLIVVLAPLFINVDSFRPELEKTLSTSLNRQVEIGKLDASLFSGGASASQITIKDDPAFNSGAFLQASSLKVGVRLMPLVFSKRLEVTSITVDKPDIVLLKNAAGKWNFSSLGASQPKSQAQPSSGKPMDVSVERFEITNGKIRIGQSSGHKAGQERIYTNVNLTANNISTTSQMPFSLSADTPGGGALKLEGKAGPLNQQDAARTPLDARVSVQHTDLATTGLIDPSSGLAGSVDFEGNLTSDGKTVRSEGKGKATNLRVVKAGAPAKAPISLDYKSDLNLDSEAGNLNTAIHTGASTVTAAGTLSAKGEDTLANLKLQGNNMAVNDVEALLPAFGVILPSGASLKGGSINMDMTAEGPLDRLVITGPLKISDTHLSGYDLSSKLGALAAFSGIKPSSDTLIQTVSSALRVAPEGIKADNIVLDVPSIGNLTGNGVIGNNNSLDFKMLLKLSGQAGNTLGQLTNISSSVIQSKGLPFLIEGTTQNPKFVPALGNDLKGGLKDTLLGAVGGKQGTQNSGQQKPDLKGVLGGIFGKDKKKTPPQ
ncbi:MAG TPA: AsmA family protein [Candidatus Limnocylindrales bacterium]|nr:AsmA family protein [Candidatus Limnocylindrales bacterium]